MSSNNDHKDYEPLAYQEDMFGDSQRILPWKNMIRTYIRKIGDREDLTETEFHKKIAGMAYSNVPALEQVIKAISQNPDVEFGRKLFAKFFELDETPPPETVARQTRKGKSELKEEGKLRRGTREEDEDSFNDLLCKAENLVGDYNSGIETRFKIALRKRFPDYRWAENQQIVINDGAYRGRTIYPDFICERLGISIEIDSLEFHADSDRFIADRQKARIMQFLGYDHLQFSGPELSIQGGFQIALREIENFIRHRNGRPKAA